MAQPLTLDYGTERPGRLRRRWVVRGVVIVMLVTGAWAAWRYGPAIARHWRMLAVQGRLMNASPAERVIFTLDNEEADRLRSGPQPSGGRYRPLFGRGGVMGGRLIRESDLAAWEVDGSREYRESVPGAYREDGLLATVALTRADGERRLVILQYDVFGMYNCMEMSVEAVVVRPGTVFARPRAVGDVRTFNWTFLFKPKSDFGRLWTPVVDPADGSRFTMRYETKVLRDERHVLQAGRIEGRLTGDDRLVLRRME